MSDSKGHLSGPHGAGAAFCREVTPLYSKTSTTEPSYYPAIKELWSKVIEDRGLPFEVRASTAEERVAGGADFPDVALYDAGDFAAVYAEVKLPTVNLKDLALGAPARARRGLRGCCR